MDEMNNQINEPEVVTPIDAEQASDPPKEEAPKTFVQTIKKLLSKKSVLLASVAVLLIIALATTLILVFKKSPLEKCFALLEKADNYQAEITISNIPLLGTMTMTQKVDGNITYTPAILFEGEKYTETVGEDVYVYTKNDDNVWVKEKQDDSTDNDELTDTFEELFDPKNFEKVKGEKNTYKQKDDVTFDNFEDVIITVGEDELTIEMTMKEDGMSLPVSIVISKIGKINLTLPNA